MTSGPLVYGLLDEAGELRYIGKTIGNLEARVRRHLREAATSTRTNHRLSWLRSLGGSPGVIVLARVAAGDLSAMEVALIARARSAGRRLVNGTDGGEGMLNPNEATRSKLRARELNLIPADRRDAGRSARWDRDRLSPVERERRRAERAERSKLAARKPAGVPHGNSRPKTPEHRAKLAEATRRHIDEHGHPRKGATVSDETRAKLRAAWERRKARTAA